MTEPASGGGSSPGTATREPLIVLDHVNKWFGDLHVLQDINLTVGKGEVVVVIGPSGSGKSTLCRAINRLETIDKGTISLDGQPLPEEGKALAALRAEVGMVFQSFNLFAHKTILRERHARPDQGAREGARTKPRSAARSCSTGSAWANRPRSTPPSSRVASSSEWRSRARSRWSPR